MLYLQLDQDATRASLVRQVLAALPEKTRSMVLARFSELQDSDGHCHDLSEVEALIGTQGLPADVVEDACSVYSILATAEASVHGCAIEDTHFHEVGNHASIASVLLFCLAIHELAPDAICASPVQTGYGTVSCAHGVLDIPAPATKAILDRGIPTCRPSREGEWCTPTSAAIILHFVERFDS